MYEWSRAFCTATPICAAMMASSRAVVFGEAVRLRTADAQGAEQFLPARSGTLSALLSGSRARDARASPPRSSRRDRPAARGFQNTVARSRHRHARHRPEPLHGAWPDERDILELAAQRIQQSHGPAVGFEHLDQPLERPRQANRFGSSDRRRSSPMSLISCCSHIERRLARLIRRRSMALLTIANSWSTSNGLCTNAKTFSSYDWIADAMEVDAETTMTSASG